MHYTSNTQQLYNVTVSAYVITNHYSHQTQMITNQCESVPPSMRHHVITIYGINHVTWRLVTSSLDTCCAHIIKLYQMGPLSNVEVAISHVCKLASTMTYTYNLHHNEYNIMHNMYIYIDYYRHFMPRWRYVGVQHDGAVDQLAQLPRLPGGIS